MKIPQKEEFLMMISWNCKKHQSPEVGPSVLLAGLVNHTQDKSPCFEGALLKYTSVAFACVT